MKALHCKLSKAKRLQLAANSKRMKVAVKKTKKNGTASVFSTQLFAYAIFQFEVERLSNTYQNRQVDRSAHLARLRTGGPGLRGTQVYPAKYGKKICALHLELMD